MHLYTFFFFIIEKNYNKLSHSKLWLEIGKSSYEQLIKFYKILSFRYYCYTSLNLKDNIKMKIGIGTNQTK